MRNNRSLVKEKEEGHEITFAGRKMGGGVKEVGRNCSCPDRGRDQPEEEPKKNKNWWGVHSWAEAATEA